MTRRLAGATAAFLGLFAGLWLVLAPFALGVQPSGKDWTDETWTDVATGGALALLGLVGVVAFAAALRQHLVEHGLVTPRPRHAPVPPAETARPNQPAPEQTDSELSALIAPLVTALTQDLGNDRHDGKQPIPGYEGGGQPR